MANSNKQSTAPAYIKNRNLARLVCLVSGIALVAVFYVEYAFGRSQALSCAGYVLEAILIASVADGIAVYALTNKINLPFMGSFTGLVQNKREELIDGIVVAFKEKLFPEVTVKALVKKVDVVYHLKNFLKGDSVSKNSQAVGKALSAILIKNKETIASSIVKTIGDYIRTIDSTEVINGVHGLAKKNGWLGDMVGNLFENVNSQVRRPDFREELESMIRSASRKEQNSGNFLEKMSKKIGFFAAEKSNTLNYSDLADDIQSAIIHTLDNILNEGKRAGKGGKWIMMEEAVSDVILKLAGNSPFNQELNAWKYELFQRCHFEPYFIAGIETLAKWLEDGKITKTELDDTFKYIGVAMPKNISTNAGSDEVDISLWLSRIIATGLERMERSEVNLQSEFEKLANKFIENEYDEVLVIVKDILRTLSDDDLVRKVNDIAGGNLQWLRISGAYVGGVVGLLLFIVIEYPIPGLAVMIPTVIAIKYSKRVQGMLVKYCGGA